MTPTTVMELALVAVATLGVLTGGFFLFFAWVMALLNAGQSILMRDWNREAWQPVCMLLMGGLVGQAVGWGSYWLLLAISGTTP